MKAKIVSLLAILLLGSIVLNAQVTGQAFIKDQNNHAGIKVKFLAQSPTAKTDSTITGPDGTYNITVYPGLYKIMFLKTGLQTVSYYNNSNETVLLQSGSELKPIYLLPSSYIYIKGDIKGSLARDNVYVFTDNVTVRDTLIIEPGTKIYLYKGVAIFIEGKLIANGTINDSITFTSYERLFKNSDFSTWNGFKFNNTNDTLKLNYCNISYIDNNHGEFKGNSKITNCFFWNCGYVYACLDNEQSSEISSCTFKDCSYVGFGYCNSSTPRSTIGIFSCNKVTNCLQLQTIANSLLIENNYFNFGNNVVSGNWCTMAKGMNFRNNILTNFLHLNFQMIAENPRFPIEYNTFQGVNLHIVNPVYNLLNNPTIIKNNIFDCNVISSVPGNPEPGPGAGNLQVLYNLISGNVTGENKKLGFGEKITNNVNGDPVDAFNNVLATPGFLNNKAPYISSTSPALGAGIGENGQPVNIGFDPTGTCLENYFKKEPEIKSADTLNISGKVHAGTTLLSSGIVLASNKLTGKNKIAKVLDGNFKIDSLPLGDYLLYAIPDPKATSAYISTYWVNKIKQDEAHTIPLTGKVSDIDIYLVPVNRRATGTASIYGRFEYGDTNTDDTTIFGKRWFPITYEYKETINITGQPARNMSLTLKNGNNEIVSATATDWDGYFKIPVLTAGTYQVFAERRGYATENGGLTLVAEGERVKRSYKIVPTITGLEEGDESNMPKIVVTNPFREELKLKYQGDITITDITGNVYFNSPLDAQEKINTSQWPTGLYLVKAGLHIYKIVKQ